MLMGSIGCRSAKACYSPHGVTWLRTILPALVSTTVLLNALLCLCGPNHAPAGDPAPAAPAACHGPAVAIDEEPTPHVPRHGGCGCNEILTISEVSPTPEVAAPVELPAYAAARWPVRGAEDLPLTRGLAAAIRSVDDTLSGDGGTLLRQRCALNL